MSGRACLVALALPGMLCGCREAPRPSPPPAVVAAALPPDAAPPRAPAPGAEEAASADEGETGALEEALESEAPEENPRSESVKIKLLVTPAVDAVVMWGGKRIGKAGREPLELVRPRYSGPLDVIVQAPGYLPFHTRLFTDRDDKVSVRLVHAHGGGAPPGERPAAAPAPGGP